MITLFYYDSFDFLSQGGRLLVSGRVTNLKLKYQRRGE